MNTLCEMSLVRLATDFSRQDGKNVNSTSPFFFLHVSLKFQGGTRRGCDLKRAALVRVLPPPPEYGGNETWVVYRVGLNPRTRLYTPTPLTPHASGTPSSPHATTLEKCAVVSRRACI